MICITGENMKFKITNKKEIDFIKCDLILIEVFEEYDILEFLRSKINKNSFDFIYSLIKYEKFKGRFNHIILCNIPNVYSKYVLFVGLGKIKKLNYFKYKIILRNIIKVINNKSYLNILYIVSDLYNKDKEIYWKIRQTIEILQELTYNFDKFKSIKKKSIQLFSLTFNIYEEVIDVAKLALLHGLAIDNSIKIAKDLGNMPPNICNPLYLAKKAKDLENIYPFYINTSIFRYNEIKELGMNAYLAVSQGSDNEPIMSVMKYRNKQDIINKNPIVFIGKGLTFDSGGISLKPAKNMHEMKYDMCGAASVYGLINFAALLKLPLYIIGIIAGCENMINGNALKPGDIISTMSGKTVEILNTDAEGRLVLCDVLTYVKRFNPKFVIDIATLTGACAVALGKDFTGLMSNCKSLIKKLEYSSKQTHDYIWNLPINDILKKYLNSNVADIANVGGSYGGAITAGYFLSKFAKEYNWAHLDIAGTAWSFDDIKGSTGRPLLLLTQFLINLCEKK